MSQSSWYGSKGASSSAGSSSQRPRATNFKPCANPIFESWIMEWKAEAEAKDTKLKYVYGRALQSIRKYPLPLKDGKECSILEHFGSHMCRMIDNRMTKENLQPTDSGSNSAPGLNEIIDSNEPSQVNRGNNQEDPKKKKRTATNTVVEVINLDSSDDEQEVAPPNPKQRKVSKQYVPAYRSGAYALLVALGKKDSEPGYRGYMTKSELHRDAQNYCDASMTKPDSTKNSHYSAWNSMKTLIAKELVLRRGSPAQFFLTPEGRSLAEKLLKAETGAPPPQMSQMSNTTINTDDVSTDEDIGDPVDLPIPDDDTNIRLEPGKFEVVLYVDTCETNGPSKARDVINVLQKNGVIFHVQRLSIGDFAWVCRETIDFTGNRHRLTVSATSQELILPFIVERKRTDDLAHSIRDGRYREQKYRLTQTKLNVIYLMESYGKGDWGLAEGALSQAMCNTQIESGFILQNTSSIEDTCAYLTYMTRNLKTAYESKTVIGRRKANYNVNEKPANPNEEYLMLFSDFNDFAIKKTHWKAKEMFARHLMRMKGLSVQKTIPIVQLYPTVNDLWKAYKECATEREKELMLSSLNFGNSNRKIGPVISRKVFQFYNSKGADFPA